MAGMFSSLWGCWTTRRDNSAATGVSQAEDVIAEFESGMAIPDDLVDAFLDGEVATERHPALFAALRSEPDSHARLDELEHMIETMREDATSPDLTGRILGEVHRRCPLLDCVGLRRASLVRWSMAACLILAATAFFTIRRAAPEATTLTPAIAPIGELTKSLPSGSSGAFIAARSAALESVRLINSEPASMNPCSDGQVKDCDTPCQLSCLMVVTAPVLDTRLLLASWLESVEDIAAFAETPSPSQQRHVRTMRAAWSPAPNNLVGEAPRISVRALLLEPGRSEQAEEGDRLLPTPRR